MWENILTKDNIEHIPRKVVHEVMQMALLPAQKAACATHQPKLLNTGESITRTLSTIQMLLFQLISMISQIMPLQM